MKLKEFQLPLILLFPVTLSVQRSIPIVIYHSLFSTLYKLCQTKRCSIIMRYNNEIFGFCNASDFCNLNYIHIHVSILIVPFYCLISFDLEFYITINLLPRNANKRHKKQLNWLANYCLISSLMKLSFINNAKNGTKE